MRARTTIGLAVVAAAAVAVTATALRARGGRPIRAGVLHSLTGTMRISESPVADATLLAIDELNARGGLLGRRVEAVLVDARSDPATFAAEAARLLDREKVSVIFGCWTSASRKTVKPLIEERGALLFYPVQYEGLEQSPGIVHTGAAPNQQIVPAVKWSADHLGKRFFLVGSDYVFPRTANAVIRDLALALGAEIVGERYVKLGSADFAAVVDEIAKAQPSVVFNTVNGDDNIALFRELRRAGLTPDEVATMSFSIAEPELQSMGAGDLVGAYVAANYFQSVVSPENEAFVRRFRERYGAERVTSDAMEAAYLGVHLWAQAVIDADTDDPARVRETVRRQSWSAPGGIVYVDPETLHTWKTVRIGRVRADGQLDILWSSEKPVRPVPYPISRSEEEWQGFLASLQAAWGGRWAAP